MEQKKHWSSFGELNNSETYKKEVKDEFTESLPFVEDETVMVKNGSFLQAKAPRRDFLKYLGFSTDAAAAAASCEMPIKKANPFARADVQIGMFAEAGPP